MDWISIIIGIVFFAGGLVLYWLEYEVVPGMSELLHWWKTVSENHFIGIGLLYCGMGEMIEELWHSEPFLKLVNDVGVWISVQIVVSLVLLPIALQLLLGVIKTRRHKCK